MENDKQDLWAENSGSMSGTKMVIPLLHLILIDPTLFLNPKEISVAMPVLNIPTIICKRSDLRQASPSQFIPAPKMCCNAHQGAHRTFRCGTLLTCLVAIYFIV